MSGTNKSAVRTVGKLLRPHRTQIAMVGVVGLISAVLSLAQPLLVGNVVRGMTGSGVVIGSLVTLGGVFAADIVLQVAEMYLLGRIGATLVLETRRTVVDRLLRAPLSTHLVRRRGDLFAGAVADTDLLRSSLATGLLNIAAGVLLVAGGIILMTILDPLLTGVTMTCLAAAAVANIWVARFVRRAMVENRAAVGKYGAALQQALNVIGTIKVSRAESRERTRVMAHAEDANRADMRGVRLQAAMSPLINLGIHGSFAVVFVVGGARIASGALDTGTFASYLLYLFYMLAPLITIFTSIAQIQLGVAAAQRVTDLAELPDEEQSRNASAEPQRSTSSVLEFDSVSFSYPGSSPVLERVSFKTMEQGLTAIVGPSGTGKTTLFSLAAGLWPSVEGRITLGGVDIGTLPLESLRGRIGLVEQDAPVLDGTIEENLRYANPDASDAQVERAVRLACLKEWVDALPNGLRTPVGESGAAISGGQRQRIAIARMLLLEPDVLLLDEVTSQLDAEAELALRRSVAEIAGSRPVIVVAHRLSTVVNADRIIVLEHGRVRAVGDHQSLLDGDELYRRLVTTQLIPESHLQPARRDS
ncbi:ABC transporter ATP-binding protein [Amycolatopsis sp. H20-H5]|uniref:ABC transporter ATP-binding protein n=1 Tax=Amycolatopsis sp. H20-H5 TaxID=3046309 RepID=UPI002DB7EAE6|nr:ABC transporter ATP-binding protein [Amycolatopsis sp. H20-H5]MEC3975567.1 ABC transporter ATP-binding protein [Amycolatopsis sp. H20-H5]